MAWPAAVAQAVGPDVEMAAAFAQKLLHPARPQRSKPSASHVYYEPASFLSVYVKMWQVHF
jgi:hypothetical protein